MKYRQWLLTALSIGFVALNSVHSFAYAELFPENLIEKQRAEEALSMMMSGNQRFIQNQVLHPHQSHQHLVKISSAQHPMVAILACADSRLAPELIFDQGLGDIFDVRVAGNIADKGVLGSLEYAVEHLHVPLIVVLGHQDCGAIAATLAHQHPHNDVGHIIHAIAPATHHGHDSVEMAEKNNVSRVIHKLQKAPILGEYIKAGKLQVVGGYYHMETGQVELLSSPEIDKLLMGQK